MPILTKCNVLNKMQIAQNLLDQKNVLKSEYEIELDHVNLELISKNQLILLSLSAKQSTMELPNLMIAWESCQPNTGIQPSSDYSNGYLSALKQAYKTTGIHIVNTSKREVKIDYCSSQQQTLHVLPLLQ